MTTTDTLRFADLALAEPLLRALQKTGYEQPTPIQAESIPHLLAGRDLLGTAQTGTGKTAAFALPLLSRINLAQESPQLLVLTPTRELAIQVAEAFKTYAQFLPGFHVLPVYGGQNMSLQLKQLRRGVHVVVGTPGRIMDHLRRGTLQLDQLASVVLDEADEMLRMGFIDDVTWILDHTPAERQVALFSATMPKPIRAIANRYLRDPKQVAITASKKSGEQIAQFYWLVSGINKLDALTRMLEVEATDAAIIFVRTKNQTVELADKLEARGYRASAINGDMAQRQREQMISQLKDGRIDILVATDVAARGIDVARVSHVINYDIPYDSEAYTHRIGRTGRAGRAGKAILFVAPREQRLLQTLERSTGQKIAPISLPGREQVEAIRLAQFKAGILDALQDPAIPAFTDLAQQLSQEAGISVQELAGVLTLLAQKDKPLLLPDWKNPPPAEREHRFERPFKPHQKQHRASSKGKPAGDRPPRKKPAGKPGRSNASGDKPGGKIRKRPKRDA